jgi:outer membrane protein assembly complex protein YaeT
LKRSLGALQEALVRKGFPDAGVTTNRLEWNQATGAVTLGITVTEGLRTIVRSVNVEIVSPENKAVTNRSTLRVNQPYSALWQQKLARQLQSRQYPQGRPNATVAFTVSALETNISNVQLDLTARVETGPRVDLGEVIFSGNQRTRSSVLASRVNLAEGSPLDPLAVEESRQSLARLGVFDSVGFRYEEADAPHRNVVFELKETRPMSLSLLAGYGSYELLRGGLEFEHRNVFGLAQGLHGRVSQSFKATRGELQYTVPEVFDENLDLFLKGSGLRREEVSFTREEYGASVGARKRLDALQTDLAVHYDYEFLNALDVAATTSTQMGVQQARVATFNIELNHDRRDNPLLPRRGFRLFSKFAFASAALGGEVDYQRIILSGSCHFDLRGGRLLHLGLTHGMTFTAGGDRGDLPFNKRFFPGGENSVRGFQEGEASPLDANGKQLGAETFTQANLEFEQLLTRTWSLVTFMDTVGFARDRGRYPWDETLYSVGGGIRWRTLIGPVRLEYGHNLNPRQHDPRGTLHFSIGFPF